MDQNLSVGLRTIGHPKGSQTVLKVTLGLSFLRVLCVIYKIFHSYVPVYACVCKLLLDSRYQQQPLEGVYTKMYIILGEKAHTHRS